MSFFFAPAEQGPRRLRTAWRFLLFAAGCFIIQVGVGVAVVVAAIVKLEAEGKQAGFDSDGGMEWLADEFAWMAAAMAVPLTGLTLGLCLLCRRFLDRRSIASLGFVKPARRLTAGVLPGFLFGAAPIVIAAGVLWALGAYRLETVAAPLEAAILTPTLILMAFNEEIVFRGYLLQNLLDVRRRLFGVLFTSIVFWLMHSMNPAAWTSPLVGVNLFGAGVLLALAYRLSGNIWFPTALHFGWNFAQGVLLSLPVSGLPVDGVIRLARDEAASHWLTGGEFGLEASVLITVLEAVMILLLDAAIQRESSEPAAPQAEEPRQPGERSGSTASPQR